MRQKRMAYKNISERPYCERESIRSQTISLFAPLHDRLYLDFTLLSMYIFFLCISTFIVISFLLHLPWTSSFTHSVSLLPFNFYFHFFSFCLCTDVGFSVSKTIPSFLSTSHTLLDFIRYYIPILHHHQLYPRLRLFMQQVRRQLVSLRNHPTNEPDSFTVVDLVPTFFFSTPPLSSSLSLIHPLTRTIQKRYAPFLSHFYPRRWVFSRCFPQSHFRLLFISLSSLSCFNCLMCL